MLPPAPLLTPELAQRWAGHRVPPRATWAVVVLWLVAFGVAVATDTTPCTAADPSVCGPDQAFAWWFVVCAATPVLLVWMPLLGCVAGVSFALAELSYDDVDAARAAFAVGGLACALLGGWLVVAARRQEAVVSGGSLVPAAGTPRDLPAMAPRVAAVTLVVLGLACLGWYRHAVQEEDAHLNGHVVRTATVVDVDEDDYVVRLALPPPRPRQVSADVLDAGTYREGAQVPVRLDPQDPSWVRLVAEPLDVTYWESAGLGAFLLALLLLGRQELVRRRAASYAGVPAAALAVRVLRDPAGELVILPAGDTAPIPVARVTVAPEHADAPPTLDEPDGSDPESDRDWGAFEQAEFGRFWRGESDPPPDDPWWQPQTPEPAVLLGRLHDRGVVAVMTDGSLEVPRGPLRLLGPQEALSGDEEVEDLDDLPGVPLAPDPLSAVPSTPVVARPPALQRLLGAAMLATAYLAVPGFLLLGPSDTSFRVLAVLLGGNLVLGGTTRVFQQVVVAREALEVVARGSRYVVPWERLHGVRRTDALLAVAWEPDVVVELGPFDRADCRDTAARAEQLGRLMMTLRERSLAAGPAGRDVVQGVGPAPRMLLVYTLVVVAAVVRLLG